VKGTVRAVVGMQDLAEQGRLLGHFA
jgi:hypothetical protein